MQTPDYQGGSIVNLMASLMAARGGESAYQTLRLLPPTEIIGVTNLILLVIDGLGAEYLARHSPQGLLSRHLRGAITSVFPSTTATAIPCFLTGEAPQQHGLTGWFTWLRELGCVMTVLPGHPRYGGGGYRQAGIDPARFYGLTPVFRRLLTPSVVVSPNYRPPGTTPKPLQVLDSTGNRRGQSGESPTSMRSHLPPGILAPRPLSLRQSCSWA